MSVRKLEKIPSDGGERALDSSDGDKWFTVRFMEANKDSSKSGGFIRMTVF